MTNISSKITHNPLRVSPPQLKAPEEFCPVKLWRSSQKYFGWNIEEFSYVFGWEPSTVERWMWGAQKAGRAARIHAAELKAKWEKECGIRVEN